MTTTEREAKAAERLPRPDLLPARALLSAGRVCAYGLDREGRDPERWRKLAPREHLASALRHVLAFLSGVELDPVTGEPHLAHAATRILYALDRSIDVSRELREEAEARALTRADAARPDCWAACRPGDRVLAAIDGWTYLGVVRGYDAREGRYVVIVDYAEHAGTSGNPRHMRDFARVERAALSWPNGKAPR